MSTNIPKGPQTNDRSAGEEASDVDVDSSNQPDPKLDRAGPEKIPNNPTSDSIAKKNAYSPNFKSEPQHKPVHDADIDTQGG